MKDQEQNGILKRMGFICEFLICMIVESECVIYCSKIERMKELKEKRRRY